MDPGIYELITKIEALVGPQGLMKILGDGLADVSQRFNRLTRALTDPEGELAFRLQRIAKEVEPDAALRFERGGDGIKVTVRGQIKPELGDHFREAQRELAEEIMGGFPVPNIGSTATVEKVDEDEV